MQINTVFSYQATLPESKSCPVCWLYFASGSVGKTWEVDRVGAGGRAGMLTFCHKLFKSFITFKIFLKKI